jgi:PHD/YefM family antitoxin component YafN of YafNO toxin-antitoxin module
MKGIQFVVDDKGEKTAVLIDLQEYGELWEDFYDCLIAHARADEPRESLAEVREQLRQHGGRLCYPPSA